MKLLQMHKTWSTPRDNAVFVSWNQNFLSVGASQTRRVQDALSVDGAKRGKNERKRYEFPCLAFLSIYHDPNGPV